MRGHGIGTAPTFLQHCVHTPALPVTKCIAKVGLSERRFPLSSWQRQSRARELDENRLTTTTKTTTAVLNCTPHRTGALLHKRKLQKSRKSRPFPLDLGTNLNTNQVRVSAITKWYCNRGYLSSCRVSPVAHVVPGIHPRYHLPLPPRCREPPPKEGRGGVPQHNLSLPI